MSQARCPDEVREPRRPSGKKSFGYATFVAIIGLVAALVALPVPAQQDSLRPQVGEPLQRAQTQLQAGKYGQALESVEAAAAIAGLSPYERFIVERMRGSALAGAGDAAGSAAAFEKVLAAKRLPPEEELRIIEAVAGGYLRAKNYAKAIEWVEAYRAAGGRQPQTLAWLPQAHYFSGDYRKAAQEAGALIAAREKAGEVPPEDELRLLLGSQARIEDGAGYARTLEKMVRYHPSKEHWNQAIRRAAARAGFSRHLELDMYRLLRATDNLDSADDYMQAAQLASLARLHGEARSIIQEGYARKRLGEGTPAQIERHGRLRSLVERQYAEDRASIAGSDAEAAAAGGDALLRTGLAHVTYGDTDKGLPMMELGLRKGGLKRPEQARLHLAYANYLAGRKDKARQVLADVGGSDGAADLARLWLILLGRR